MTPGETYRVKAAELHAKAQHETNMATRVELERLARSYVRLAEQADRNAQADVYYEPPSDQPSIQQQQQIQPKKDEP